MLRPLNSEEKAVLILLVTVIFYYHGFDEEEEATLQGLVQELDAQEQYKWAFEFIAEDYVSSYERAREWMKGEASSFDDDGKLQILERTWRANQKKGYVTEIETAALVKIARDWNVAPGFAQVVLRN